MQLGATDTPYFIITIFRSQLITTVLTECTALKVRIYDGSVRYSLQNPFTHG